MSSKTCFRVSVAASTIMVVMALSFVATFLILPREVASDRVVTVMGHNRHQFFDENAISGLPRDTLAGNNTFFISGAAEQQQLGPVKLTADGHEMRIKPLYQIDELRSSSPESAQFLEDVVIPLSIQALTRTFSLQNPKPSPLLFERKCKRSLTWSSGEKECNELFSESDQWCSTAGVIPSDMFGEAKVCSGNSPGDCRSVRGGKGAEDTDFVLVVTASGKSGNCDSHSHGDMSAQGGFCIVDDDSDGRPLAGFINFCPDTISTDVTDLGKQVDLAVHEILHALVFEPSLIEKFKDSTTGRPYNNAIVKTTDPGTGLERRIVTTPRVKEFVQKHFNCPTLEGADLENQGGSGTQWSHWEESLFYDEVMTGLASGSGRSVLSNLTLALMEDSGWYKPDYSFAGYLGFGENAGCDFVENKCRSDASDTSKYYCSQQDDVSCTFNGFALGKCEVNPLADGCGIVKGFGNYLCGDISNSDRSAKPLQHFDSYSLCVKGSDQQPKWKVKSQQIGSGGRVMNVQTTYPSGSDGCFGFKCVQDKIFVQMGDREVLCEPGAFIDLASLGLGFSSGTFGPCPQQDVCSEQLSCQGRCNPVHGYCSQGLCHCHLGYFGHYCENKLVPQLI
jgi:hypothetical protein